MQEIVLYIFDLDCRSAQVRNKFCTSLNSSNKFKVSLKLLYFELVRKYRHLVNCCLCIVSGVLNLTTETSNGRSFMIA